VLRELGTGTWKHWDINLAEVTWLVYSIETAKHLGKHPQTKPPCIMGGGKVPVGTLHIGKWLGRQCGLFLPWEKAMPLMGRMGRFSVDLREM